MALRPLADHLLVRGDPNSGEYVTKGGSKLSVDRDPNAQLPVGTIIRAGWISRIFFGLVPGKRILYRQYCGEKCFLYDDVGRLLPNMLVVKREDVIGFDDGTGAESLPKENNA